MKNLKTADPASDLSSRKSGKTGSVLFRLGILFLLSVRVLAYPDLPANSDRPDLPSLEPSCREDVTKMLLAATTSSSAADLSSLFHRQHGQIQAWVVQQFREYILAKQQGGERKARELSQTIDRAMKIWIRVFPRNDPFLPWPQALSWNRKTCRLWVTGRNANQTANAYFHRGEFEQARRLWEQALSIFRKIQDQRVIANVLMNLGLSEYESGNLDKAMDRYRQAMEIFHRILDDHGTRDCKVNLSLAYEMRGNYAQALRLQEEAWRLNRTLCDPLVEARILSNMGVIATENGYLKEAEVFYTRSLFLRRQGDDKEGEATDLSNLGVIYDQLGHFGEAQTYIQNSLALRRNLGDREGEADSLLNLAAVLNHQGRAGESLQHLFQAIQICRMLQSPHRLMNGYIHAGEVYLAQGQLGEAETHLQAALKLSQIHSFASDQAWIWKLLADSATRQGLPSLSMKRLNQAETFYRQTSNPLELAGVRLELAKVLRQEERPAEAAQVFLQGLRLAEECHSWKLTAEIQLHLGEIALETSQPKIAEFYFRSASDISSRTGFLHLRWRSLHNLSQSFLDQGLFNAGLHYLQQAIGVVLEQESYLSVESLTQHFWDDKAHLFRKMSRYACEQQTITDGWRWIDSMKARHIKKSRRQWAGPFSTEPDEERAEVPILSTQKALQSLHRHLLGIQSTDVLTQADSSLKIEAMLLDAQSSRDSRRVATALPPDSTADWAGRLQRNLQEDEVLLDFAFSDDSLSVWMIGHNTKYYFRLYCRETEIRTLLKQAGICSEDVSYLEKVSQNSSPLPQLDSRTLQALSRVLWLPLAKQIHPHVQNLVIIPDGILHLIPFEILPDIRSDIPASDNEDQTVLLDRFAIHYLPAASFLLEREKSSGLTPQTAKMVLLAGDSSTATVAPKTAAPSDLPIGGEIREIQRLFPRVDRYSNFQDWRNRALYRLAQADLLHIATHYQYNAQHPEASRFFFSNRSSESEGLFAAETALLPMHPRLAILSACATALGPIVSGEGILNMGRSFLLAGARSIILSCWPVEEDSTTELMTLFYRYLTDGMDSRTALRQAKQRLRQKAAWRHPFYWGAFVLVGNPFRFDSGNVLPIPDPVRILLLSALASRSL